jgi:hypothetical protein
VLLSRGGTFAKNFAANNLSCVNRLVYTSHQDVPGASHTGSKYQSTGVGYAVEGSRLAMVRLELCLPVPGGVRLTTRGSSRRESRRLIRARQQDGLPNG